MKLQASRILETSSGGSRLEFITLGSFNSLDCRMGVGQLSKGRVRQPSISNAGVWQLSRTRLGQLSRHTFTFKSLSLDTCGTWEFKSLDLKGVLGGIY